MEGGKEGILVKYMTRNGTINKQMTTKFPLYYLLSHHQAVTLSIENMAIIMNKCMCEKSVITCTLYIERSAK